MAPSLKTLQQRRAAHRTRAGKAIQTASTTATTEDCTSVQLQGQIDVLKRNLATLEDLDTQILELLTDDAQVEQEIANAGDRQDELVDMIAQISKTMMILDLPTISPSVASLPTQPADQSVHPDHQLMARLPKLELPPFSGDPLKWSSFWDSFESSIHSNPRLPDIDKLNYLRGLLRNTALDSIAGIQVSSANYPTAINMIQGRFGQKQTIITGHVQALVNLPKVCDDIWKLRNLFDTSEVHIRGLETQGVATQQTGVILAPILLSKLPDDICLIINRKNGGPIADLDTLRDLLKVEIEVRELSISAKKQIPRQRPEHQQEFTASAMVSNSSNGFCGFCRQPGHRSIDCRKFPTSHQRIAKVKKDNLCNNCLRPGHGQMDCPSSYTCRNCHTKHHSELCTKGFGSNREGVANHRRNWNQFARSSNVNVASHGGAEDGVTITATTSPTLVANSSTVLMQTAVAVVPDANGTLHHVRLLFDTASDRSYMTRALASKLSVNATCSTALSIAPFGQPRASPKRYDVATVQCANTNGSGVYNVSAVIVPSITCPIYRTSVTSSSTVLKNLKLADPPTAASRWMNIDILIGLDQYWQLVQDDIVRLPDQGLVATSSVFGWLISGRIKDSNNPTFSNALFIKATPSTEDDLLTKFWESESLEFAENKTNTAHEKDVVLQQFENTLCHTDGRYEVSFPWKPDVPELPKNYYLSRNRLGSLVKKLNRDGTIRQYDEVLQKQLELQFIEIVNDPGHTAGVVHYIPHHPVIKAGHTTTKMRIVYDASAKQSPMAPSLNECLYTGPNLIAELMQLLLKFRTHKFVILADIEKAFLQVGLRQEDRDATRFLWLKDPTKPFSDDNIAVYRFRRVPFGATCSPFLLAATLQHHLRNSSSEAAKKLQDQFYVDNLVSGVNEVSEAKPFYDEVKKVLLEAGMNLREWVSNCSEFSSSIPPSDRASGNLISVLGVIWNVKSDSVQIKGAPILSVPASPTKRQLLQTIAKVFDPLGIVSPIVIRSKIFMQKLWKINLPWDSCLPTELIGEWKFLNDELKAIDDIRVPRHLQVNDATQLHVFVDASTVAYAATAYVRVPTGEGIATRLVCSKSRVAPIKEVTIPRLELVAAALGCQLAKFIKNTISVCDTYIWSDSQIVLHWIRSSTQKQGVFVSNHIKEIRNSNYWFCYVPTSSNPADLPSRGVDADKLADSIWWEGPNWLKLPAEQWPPNIVEPPKGIAEDPGSQLSAVNKASTTIQEPPYGIDINRFSTLGKLLRVTSRCRRFIGGIRRQDPATGPVTAAELQDSLKLWIHFVQRQHFRIQVDLLQLKKSDILIRRMSIVLDGDVLKCHGRFQNSATESNNPILLPKKDPFTNLIIQDAHNSLLHQGVRHTLAHLRQSYWIPDGRQQVRYTLNRCHVCRLWQGQPYTLPNPPPLPALRVTQDPAFSYTGCDFAEPMYVFSNSMVKKAYICLFTCAVTRAVHLELVEDLTTRSFLLALRRFISRRGTPKEIISDNAKTVKMAKLTLDRVWNNIVASDDTISDKGIKWKFNVERAPWWGGFFERMVGIVKRALIKTIGKSKMSPAEFATVLVEVEAVVNTRPLTYVHNDVGEGAPLMPCNFLSDAKHFGTPSFTVHDDEDYADPLASSTNLIKCLAACQKMVDHFWKVWLNEYLPTLREHHQRKPRETRSSAYNPHVGDVVLVKQEGLKRAHWKLGIVKQLFHGKDDGLVRAAQVECKGRQLFQRAISFLYPLELVASEPVSKIDPDPTTTPDATSEQTSTGVPLGRRIMPSRTTKTIAKLAIQDQLGDENRSVPEAGKMF